LIHLTSEQLELIERLQLRRDAGSLVQLLGEAWPAVAERLQDRWPAFVAAALERAHQLGLKQAAEQARFASLCCLWGAGFEAKPGFEWAAAICADGALSPMLVLHQLSHRSREELVRRQAKSGPATQALTPAAFDRALAAVEAGLSRVLLGRSVFLDQPLPAVPKACDLGSVSFAVVEPKPLQAYRAVEGRWQRADLQPWASAPQTFTAPPDEPPLLPVLSRAVSAGASARLQLAVQQLATCDAKRHPEVVHYSAGGRLHWHGADTARLSLTLHAPPTPAPDPKLGPGGIAHSEPPDLQRVSLASCGIRDAGAPLGGMEIALQVHPATQRLTEVRHGAMPPQAWPEPPPPQAVPAATACRLELDGVEQPVPVWLKAWQSLQPQCRSGLESLFNAWARQMSGTTARLEAETSPLVGQAGLAWGWQHGDDGAVLMRLQGEIDFAALMLDLRLSGDIEWAGSRARVSLRAQGRTDWRMHLDQRGETAPEGQGLAQAKCSWRHPVMLSVDAISGDHPALLSAGPLPEPLRGAVVGECGLRPRPDGKGQQWFYRLALEPVNLNLLRHDPLSGVQRQQRELLPAHTLIDWSAC
jgi:hypothetical protein